MSFDEDRGSKLRYRIENSLKKCGVEFSKNTGTWEGTAVNPERAAEQLHAVFQLLSNPKRISGVRQAHLDHIWIYVDRAKTTGR